MSWKEPWRTIIQEFAATQGKTINTYFADGAQVDFERGTVRINVEYFAPLFARFFMEAAKMQNVSRQEVIERLRRMGLDPVAAALEAS